MNVERQMALAKAYAAAHMATGDIHDTSQHWDAARVTATRNKLTMAIRHLDDAWDANAPTAPVSSEARAIIGGAA